MKRRGIGRWVIDGEHLRHDKVWSKDPDKRTCGWGTKMPKSFDPADGKYKWKRKPLPDPLKNWHCDNCRKRAPKEIQFSCDLAFVKEKVKEPVYAGTFTSSLAQLLNQMYTQKTMNELIKTVFVRDISSEFKLDLPEEKPKPMTETAFMFPVKTYSNTVKITGITADERSKERDK